MELSIRLSFLSDVWKNNKKPFFVVASIAKSFNTIIAGLQQVPFNLLDKKTDTSWP
jgi:hypothetical protein